MPIFLEHLISDEGALVAPWPKREYRIGQTQFWEVHEVQDILGVWYPEEVKEAIESQQHWEYVQGLPCRVRLASADGRKLIYGHVFIQLTKDGLGFECQ